MTLKLLGTFALGIDCIIYYGLQISGLTNIWFGWVLRVFILAAIWL